MLKCFNAIFSDSGTFNTLFLISDIWFLTDILLNLRTGVVLDDVEMEVVFDPVEIRKFYVKSWFFIGSVQIHDSMWSREKYVLPRLFELSKGNQRTLRCHLVYVNTKKT